MSDPTHDAISDASAHATAAALVQVTALENTLAATLEYIARRDGVDAVGAIKQRATQLTMSIAERSDNPLVREGTSKVAERIEALTGLSISLAQAT